MSVAFGFELIPDSAEVHGLSMGHMTVLVGDRCVSSKDKNQPMMIFVTLSELLDAAIRVFRGGRATVTGTDSSFEIGFDCTCDIVTLSDRRSIIGKASRIEVVEAIWTETQRFVSEYWEHFSRVDPTSAAAFDDLSLSMRRFTEEVHLK
jgi:hypothetical protein